MPTLIHRGKVRDVYADGRDAIIVASDRISVYDVVLPTPIPGKGKILTALSTWWLERTVDIMPNHLLSTTNVPAEFAGRAQRCKMLEMYPAEFIARGYLAGLGLEEYRAKGSVSGVALPAGLQIGSRLDAPIFTPTTKAPVGAHDTPLTHSDLGSLIGTDEATFLGRKTVELYTAARDIAAAGGIALADTKFEFGTAVDGQLLLADEFGTPDSSRYWALEGLQPGTQPRSLDKQFVRDWAAGTGWDKRAPGPELPDNIVTATRDLYAEVFEAITGDPWH
jgi:phosphoribosylaminoimidazole-succinocarboxamide synthase